VKWSSYGSHPPRELFTRKVTPKFCLHIAVPITVRCLVFPEEIKMQFMEEDVLCPYNRSHVVPRVSDDLNSSFYIKASNKLNNEAAKVV
jgi:hypothetical protein